MLETSFLFVNDMGAIVPLRSTGREEKNFARASARIARAAAVPTV